MGSESHEFLPDDPQPGPSWQRANWPLVGGASEDELTQALDPTAIKEAIKAAGARTGAKLDPAALEAAARDTIHAVMLIRTYRVRGHLAADLDPLGLSKQELPADLEPAFHGFTTPDDLARPISRPNITASPAPSSTGRCTSAARSAWSGRACARSSRSCVRTTAAR